MERMWGQNNFQVFGCEVDYFEKVWIKFSPMSVVSLDDYVE